MDEDGHVRNSEERTIQPRCALYDETNGKSNNCRDPAHRATPLSVLPKGSTLLLDQVRDAIRSKNYSPVPLKATFLRSHRPPRPILYRLGNVRRLYLLAPRQIGDRTRQLEHAVICPHRAAKGP